MKPVVAAALLLAAAVLLAATRFPGGTPTQEASLAVAVALAVAAALTLRGQRAWLPPASMGLLAAGLLLPTSPRAFLAGLPDAVVAAVAAAAFLAVHRTDATAAPRVDSHERATSLRHALRYAPAVALMALLAALPWAVATFLPARIAASYELAGAAGPALAAAAVAVPVLAAAFAVRALWGPRKPAPPAEAPQETP
ncbi:MAG TPA: hypothetical protein VM241_06320 [Candidatus Thermoplasmatota archaeon]|nr:hypothetical protein [Candidatus Thermoplasmatota archaeon]